MDDEACMKIGAFLSQCRANERRLRVRWLVWLAACALLFITPGPSGLRAAAGDPTSDPPPTASAAAFAPGEVLVGVQRDAFPFSTKKSEKSAAWTDRPALARLSPAAVERLEITDAADAPIFLRLRVAAGEEWTTIARLQADPAIAFAEPNWIAQAAVAPVGEASTPVLPSDPLFRANQWGMQRIGAPRAWAISQGSTIRVAVIDSGIDIDHPEFAGRVLPGKNYVTPSAAPQDDSGHGTHVAGIIAAALNNGVGVAGLAPQALIDPRKVLNSRNAGTVANIAQAIRDAADDGARIINLSVTTSENSSVLEAAVTYALGKGVLLVGAAGNTAPNPVWWPAAYPGVLAVAAVDRSDQRTYYSHTGAVDLAAPGGLSSQLVYSTWPTGIKCSSAVTAGYCTAFGTSMSAAFVSGAAALVWSTRPDLSLVQIKNLLLESTRPTGSPATDVGAGRLDVQAAVRQALLSDLQPSRSQISELALAASQPYSETLSLSNPSGEPIFWQASVISGNDWLALQPAARTPSAGGSIRYGEPAQLSLIISPTLLLANDYAGAVRVTGNRTNGSQVSLTIPVALYVRSALHTSYLSLAEQSTASFNWQTPDAKGKQPWQLTDDSSIGLLLPFTFTLESQTVTTVRLYADGFLTFLAGESVAALPVACAPDETPARQAIYGWWTDLNPALGGSVSTFTSTSGAFVAEFLAVPVVASGDKVSFQMALFPDGQVKLSYAALPRTVGDVVVGMEIDEGLLSNRIACRKGGTSLGALPVSGQTITIETTDLR